MLFRSNSNTPDGGVALRGNYAGVGFVYDRTHDVFYPPKPGPDFVLDTSSWTWSNPNAAPTLGNIA